MKKNRGSIDQVVRIIIAADKAVLFFTGVIPGTFRYHSIARCRYIFDYRLCSDVSFVYAFWY